MQLLIVYVHKVGNTGKQSEISNRVVRQLQSLFAFYDRFINLLQIDFIVAPLNKEGHKVRGLTVNSSRNNVTHIRTVVC